MKQVKISAIKTNRYIEPTALKNALAKTKKAKVKHLRQEKTERMSQNASSYSHDISGKGSSSRVSDIEDCGQDAKNSFNPVTDMHQRFLHVFRPLFFLVVFSQGQQQNTAFTPKALLQFSVVIDFIANQRQISTVQHQFVQNFWVWDRRWRQHPIVNQLVYGGSHMQAKAVRFAFFCWSRRRNIRCRPHRYNVNHAYTR
jgi:hypothetical protein